MAQIRKKETDSDIVLEYRCESVNDKKSMVRWLEMVSKSTLLDIRRILLDNLSDRGDEKSESIELGRISNSDTLYKQCIENGIDVVSIMAKIDGAPIIIGADFRDGSLFVTLRKKKLANIEKLEKELGLMSIAPPKS